MKSKRRFPITSKQIIPIGFLVLILMGALFLWLPISTADGKGTDFLTALFTATTSVSVTGLVVVDTYLYWSFFGKVVILLLIQIGGLGIVAAVSLFLVLLKKRFSLKSRLLIRDSFNLDTGQGIIRFLLRVFRITFLIEGTGALLYLPVFLPKLGLMKGLWISVFTSVSAFCNAGIDIIGPDSLFAFQNDPFFLVVTMLLIIFGGIGYVVLFDLYATGRSSVEKKSFRMYFKRLSEHSKLVLVTTAILIALGAVLILVFESDNPESIGILSPGGRIINSLFQSVTFRTAGFSSVPQHALKAESAIVGLIWMFIGGSPVGTAGGVKTVTVAILVLNVWSFIRNRNETVAFRRAVPDELVRKATAIVSVSFCVTLVMSVLLILTNGFSVLDSVYEVTSATATVGLSRGITPKLNEVGRIIIILCMYFGRIGPISMALFFSAGSSDQNGIRHAEGRFFAG